jgi:hypothetical protein
MPPHGAAFPPGVPFAVPAVLRSLLLHLAVQADLHNRGKKGSGHEKIQAVLLAMGHSLDTLDVHKNSIAGLTVTAASCCKRLKT